MTPYYRWIEIEALAAGLHRRLAALHGEPVELPIDVDAVAEQLLGLSLLYEPIPEPPGTTIFGALDPEQRLIVLNERHVEMFGRNEGLERFTKAHELGHWICHVEGGGRRGVRTNTETRRKGVRMNTEPRRNGGHGAGTEGTIGVGGPPVPFVPNSVASVPPCLRVDPVPFRSPPQAARDWQERHADWFAAALLMPPSPLRKAAEGLDLGTWRGRYELRDRCGVSISALNSRLRQLGYPPVR